MYKEIVDFYIKKLIPSADYNNTKSVKSLDLLFPAFRVKIEDAMKKFNEKYPNVKLVFVETYRSNARQLMHYNNGASKIKKNGMHHYGIACDCAFEFDTDGDGDIEFSYDGDYNYLRECWKAQGLTLLGEWDKGHAQFIPVNNQDILRGEVLAEVKKFQGNNDLVPDGIVGNKTIAKAKELYS